MTNLAWMLTAVLMSGQADDSGLRVILDAYVTHRESFRYGEGSCTVVQSNARSLEEATSAALPLREQCRVFWAFQGDTCRYDTLYDPDRIRASIGKDPKEKLQTAGAASTRMLTNRSQTLLVYVPWEQDMMEVATLSADPTVFSPHRVIMSPPLLLGFPDVRTTRLYDFAGVLTAAITGQLGLAGQIEGEEQVDGESLVRVRVDGEGTTFRCRPALAAGFLSMDVL